MTAGLVAIAGHREAMTRLRGFLAEDRLPHALIFCGPSGIGKATVARALTAALFCRSQTRDDDVGCGTCGPCLKVRENHHPDYVQVELLPEKTRISVDQIREVCGFLALTPLEARLKVALIDDAALMNEAAANALLKTLEEPSAGTLLILSTSRPGSLLPTIRSRCQVMRFFPLQREELLQVARQTPTLAGIDGETLEEAIYLAEGSASRLLQLCTGELKDYIKRFRTDMDNLPQRHLADLCVTAAYWGDRERFPFAQTFLMAWFRDRIQATISGWRTEGSETRVLNLIRKSRDLFAQAEEFNLNRQMVLETLFIHLARWQGASF
ncbi:MAG: DNA polymerase III subunit delta' [Magnetococcales bacterium]|nr:DNA polymerase III subunit delta' [Magnetococcales bacterium]